MEVRRLEVDEQHDEVQVWINGVWFGAAACYKSDDTKMIVDKIVGQRLCHE